MIVHKLRQKCVCVCVCVHEYMLTRLFYLFGTKKCHRFPLVCLYSIITQNVEHSTKQSLI